ncbi:MAG: SAM-dependent methyltransferase [Mesorhizobium amorphae]|nr:MAG: SAM-dependent methyltransferase [Mesorhizobium amorphae]
MKPLDTTSGDILADRRADYAEMLFAEGEHGPAAELMLGALEMAPGWALGWFRLGEMRERAGGLDEAAEAWRMALRLDPADHAGAGLKLALIGAEAPPETPPPAFVEALFDQYAEKFDASLVQALGYRVPELLLEATLRLDPGPFARALDLGCGTGLMGEKLRPHAAHLAGCDISGEMLRKARARRVYDTLEKADLAALPFDGPPWDLVSAADVFMYLGRLDAVIAGIAAMLRPGGVLAFSVEKHGGHEDFILRETRRFAHTETYLRKLLGPFTHVAITQTVIRRDRDADVVGLIAVARRA